MGPFGHAILAGTAAAAALPFMILLRRRQHKLLGTLGVCASIIATLASASSGPIVAMATAIGLLAFWRWRDLLGRMRFCAGILLIILNFTMSRPIWFLIARMDIVGGSTGWHRSKIDRYRNESVGRVVARRHGLHAQLDVLRVTWNPNHTDITNHYLQMGVLGGLPLMIAFIAILVAALIGIERALPDLRAAGDEREFSAWCVWTSLLVHSVSFISISYFDQSYGCFFLLIGAVTAIREWEPESLEEEDDLEYDAPSRTIKFQTPVF
jgi:O-antigen ligase